VQSSGPRELVLIYLQDIIPVPVNRENCSSTAHNNGSDYMDISWRIAFAGRTPGKQILADNFFSPQLVDYRATELEKLSRQDEAELWSKFCSLSSLALSYMFRRCIGTQVPR
jgi:hypothetical protein